MVESAASSDHFIHCLANAISARGLYPAAHPLAKQPLGVLEDCLAERFAQPGYSAVTLLVVDDDLVVDGSPLRGFSLYRGTLRRILDRTRVERVTLAEGVRGDELEALTAGLCQLGALDGSEHVILGRVAGAGDGEDGDSAGQSLEERHVEALRSGLETLGSDDVRGFEMLDRAVWQLMESTAQASRSFLLLQEMKNDSERLHRHSVAVCLHAVALARSLGIEGPGLHGIAVGALLHDIGLLELPASCVWGPEAKSELSAAARRRHPELGAARLAAIPAVSEVAVLIAYEHHLRWDGQGGYPSVSRQPGLGAQITAVADVWDMVHQANGKAPRQQRRQMAREALRRWDGTVLNPKLVSAFLRIVDAQEEGE